VSSAALSPSAAGRCIGSRFAAKSEEQCRDALDFVFPNCRWDLATGEGDRPALEMSAYALPTSAVFCGSYAGGFEAQVLRDDDRLVVSFLLGGRFTWLDRKGGVLADASAGQCCVTHAESGMRARVEGGMSLIEFHVLLTTLRDRFERFTHLSLTQPIVFAPLVPVDGGRAQRLHEFLGFVIRDLDAAGPDAPDTLRQVYEDAIIAKLLIDLPHSLSHVFSREGVQAAPRQLRLAEDFMRANLTTAVGLEEIARAAGCSPRALQRIFQDHRGTTPMRMLRTLRLSAAHDALSSGRVESVTDLAMELQFSNPGRFASFYREMYGVSPSRTRHVKAASI
jgi:AraC-like DNA-binding protein